jgi:hypothetical protein
MANNDFTPNELETEEWRDVPGYEGIYMVSNLGRIWSTNCNRPLSCGPNSKGYSQVGLTINGKTDTRKVHRIVMHAFVGPCPEGYQVNHINGARTDNRLSNLEYVTPSENVRHSVDVLGNQLGGHGEANSQAKLTEETVREIRRRWSTGRYTKKQIAHDLGLNRQHVTKIVNRICWTHVD